MTLPFLRMFNCTLLAGRKGVLTQPYEVILSVSSAIKYFGTTDVLGKSIELSWFDQPFKVTGLISDSPANTHIKYNVLISQATYEKKADYDGLRWDNNDQYTYLLLSDPSQYSAFVAQLNTLNNTLHAEGKIPNERIVAQPLRDVHLYSHKSFELEQNGDAFAVFFLTGIAILVLIVAIRQPHQSFDSQVAGESKRGWRQKGNWFVINSTPRPVLYRVVGDQYRFRRIGGSSGDICFACVPNNSGSASRYWCTG